MDLSVFSIISSLLAIIATVQAAVAPDDAEQLCIVDLRSRGSATTPVYSDTMRVLMDSWNYGNLLSNDGAVWNQTVDSETGILIESVS